jgi:Zn-dependent protease
MRSSYRIFRISGIVVSLHVTLLILFLVPLLDLTSGLADAAYSFAFLLTLFSSVLVHELAHSLVALRNKVAVRQIILTPIGGISSVGMVRDARTEFKISIAGPLMSLGIAFLALVVLLATGAGTTLGKSLLSGDFMSEPSLLNFLMLVAYVNFILGMFNLFIPIFPMDGGRILRSMLCTLTNRLKATRIAVYIGQVFLSVMFAFGLLAGSIWLLAIAVFLFIAGLTELKLTEMSEKLGQVDLEKVMLGSFIVLHPDLTMADFKRIAANRQTLYPVLDDDFQTAGMEDAKEDVISKVYSSGYAFVLDPNGALYGVLTMQGIQNALKPAV